MRKIHRAILSSLLLLAVLALVGFAMSWWHPFGFDVQFSKHTNVEFRSYDGRVHLSHSYQNVPASTESMATELASDEAMDQINQFAAEVETKIDSPKVSGIAIESPRSWKWLMFEFQTNEIPEVWFGGGRIHSLAIPYWFLVLIFGFWPTYVFVRRTRFVVTADRA